MMDSELEQGGPQVEMPIATRVGFRQEAIADATSDLLRDVIAQRVPSMRDPSGSSAGAQVPAAEPVVHEEPQPEDPSGDDEIEHADVSPSHQRGGSGGTAASSPAAAAAVASPPPAASDENLSREEIGSASAQEEPAEETGADAGSADVEPESESAGEQAQENQAPATVVQVEMRAPAERIRVTGGEPIVDAKFAPKLGFQFDESGTKQVKQFPASLEALLRDDLAEMTNVEFAREVSLPSLVTAFVASQLGAVATSEALAGLDENTRTALAAFRMMDRRTGAVEGRLAELDERTEQMLDAMKSTLHVLKKHSEQTRFLENGVTFLVTERLSPSQVVDVPLSQVQMVDGKYRQVRDRLMEQTDREIRDEKIARGRPLR